MDYSYCGQNTSDVDLEVVRVVDDRFGVLEVPEEATIVSPGETLCNTDLGLPVSYVVAATDAGTTITNNAVVTVRTVGDNPQGFQAADAAQVEVLSAGAPGQALTTTTALPAPIPATGAGGVPVRVLVAMFTLVSGSLLLVIGRSRRRAD